MARAVPDAPVSCKAKVLAEMVAAGIGTIASRFAGLAGSVAWGNLCRDCGVSVSICEVDIHSQQQNNRVKLECPV